MSRISYCIAGILIGFVIGTYHEREVIELKGTLLCHPVNSSLVRFKDVYYYYDHAPEHAYFYQHHDRLLLFVPCDKINAYDIRDRETVSR